jgi:hypothetical protein
MKKEVDKIKDAKFHCEEKKKNNFWNFIIPKPFDYEIRYLILPAKEKKFQTIYDIVQKAEELDRRGEKEACKDVLNAAINHINRNF